jgi:lipooligosaccharide transport system ATP-binding protein
MRLLTAQAIADEGELEVLGLRLPEESKQARAQCGASPQLDNLDVTLTVEQNLRVFAHLYRIRRGERHVLLDGRADDLPAGLRLRVRLSGQHDRRLRWRWTDLARLPALLVFGLVVWRVAIHAMTRKLID